MSKFVWNSGVFIGSPLKPASLQTLVTVINLDTGLPAEIWSDYAGLLPLSNPFNITEIGKISFYANKGRYSVSANHLGSVQVWNDENIGEIDESQIVSPSELAAALLTSGSNLSATIIADVEARQNIAIEDEREARIAAIIDANNNFSNAIIAEANTRRTVILAEAAARANAVLAEAQARQSDINTTVTMLQDLETSVASQVDTLTASLADSNAAIQTERTTRSTAIDSLATEVNTLAASVESTVGLISEESTIRATANTALASQITVISAEAAGNSAAIIAESTARSNAIEAVAETINTVSAEVGNNAALLIQETTNRVTALSSVAVQIDALSAKYDTNSAAIVNESNSRATAIEAISDQLTAMNASLADASAAILTESQTRATADSANATQSAVLAAQIAANTASITSEATSRVTDVAALSSQITTLTASTNNNASAIAGESVARTNAVSAEAVERNALATQFRGNYIGSDLAQVTEGLLYQERLQRTTATESITQQMALITAGSNNQFDFSNIWYFDSGIEGWTGPVQPSIVNTSFLRPNVDPSNTQVTSPVLNVVSTKYTQVRARIRRVGSPTWLGNFYYTTANSTSFGIDKFVQIPEPTYEDGMATITFNVAGLWLASNVTKIKLQLLTSSNASNYIEFDWIAVGRPSPGASSAQVYDVQTAMATGDAALSSQITQLNADIATKASTAALQSLDTRVTAAEGVNSTQATALTNLRASMFPSGMIKDPTFENWTASLPTGWSAWNGAANVTRHQGQYAYTGGSAVQMLITNGNETGIVFQTDPLLSTDTNYIDIELVFTLTSGTLKGAGILIHWVNSADLVVSQSIHLDALYPTPTLGKKYVCKQRFKKPSGAGTFKQYRFYLLGNWNTFAPTSAKTIIFDALSITSSDASAEVLATQEARITAAEGAITSQSSDITTLNNSLSNASNTIATKADSSAVTALTNRVTAAEGTLSSQQSAVTTLNTSVSTAQTAANNAQTAATAANTLAGSKGKVLVQTATPTGADNVAQNLWIDITGGANTPKRWNGSAWVVVTDKVATDAAAAAASAQTTANSKADASAVTALTNRVTTAEGTIATQQAAITSLNSSVSSINSNLATKADGSALTSLTNRVTNAEGNISTLGNSLTALTGDVSGKASQTSLNTLSQQVTTNQTTTTAQGDAITKLDARVALTDNALDMSQWVVGSSGNQDTKGAATLWTANGGTAVINQITASETGPFGTPEMTWVGSAGSDAATGSGGFNVNVVGSRIDKQYGCVFYVFFKHDGTRPGTNPGGFYFGAPMNNQVFNESGAPDNNPYFNVIGIDSLVANEWYLAYGIIKPYGTTPAHSAVGGIYRVATGEKVQEATTFTATVNFNAATLTFRSYLYYSNQIGRKVYWARPTVQALHAAPTPWELMRQDKRLAATASALDTLTNKVNHGTTGLDAVAAKVTALEAAVPGKASTSALDALTVRVGTTETDNVAQSSKITALTAKLNASVLNVNSDLSDWTGLLPTGWTNWDLSGFSKHAGIYGYVSGNAMRWNVSAANNGGVQGFNITTVKAKYYDVKIGFTLATGGISGAGILFDFCNTIGSYFRVAVKLSDYYTPSEIYGVRQVAVLRIERPATWTGSFSKVNMYLMANYAECGPHSAKDIYFDSIDLTVADFSADAVSALTAKVNDSATGLLAISSRVDKFKAALGDDNASAFTTLAAKVNNATTGLDAVRTSTATAITNLEARVAPSGNLLPFDSEFGSTFGADNGGFSIAYNDSGYSGVTIRRNTGNISPQTGVNYLEIHAAGATTGGIGVSGSQIPVVAGKTYCYAAYTSAHRCAAIPHIFWLNSSGVWFDTATGAESTSATYNTVSATARPYVFATAPAGAVTALVMMLLSASPTYGTDPYLFVYKPAFYEVDASTATPPRYVPSGGSSTAASIKVIAEAAASSAETATARWEAKSTVGELVGGVGFLNDGTKVVFTVEATNFTVRDPSNPAVKKEPFKIAGGNVYLDGAVIQALSVTSEKIDSRNLSIKDASGNVIFSAGTPLTSAYADASLITPTTWINGGTAIMKGNDITSNGGWITLSNYAYSPAGQGGAIVSAKANSAAVDGMIGLSLNPTDNSSGYTYAGITYAAYCTSTGSFAIYTGPTYAGAYGTYAAGDTITVTYDGVYVKFMVNGAVRHQLTTTADLLFYGKVAFGTYGTTFKDVKAGALTTAVNPLNANSAVTVDSNGNILGIGAGAGTSVANNKNGFIRSPGGGIFTTEADTVYGAIRIKLPVDFINTMLKFTVSIYEYVASMACTLEIAGYNYSNGSWYNVTARVIGGSNVEYPVKFGKAADGKCCVWIGTSGGTWAYPQVTVYDVQLGFNNIDKSLWENGWTISFTDDDIEPGTGLNEYSAAVFDTLPGADWSKSSRRPYNLTTLSGNESIKNSDLVGVTVNGNGIKVVNNATGKVYFDANSNSAPWVIATNANAGSGINLAGQADTTNNTQEMKSVLSEGSTAVSATDDGKSLLITGLGSEIDSVMIGVDVNNPNGVSTIPVNGAVFSVKAGYAYLVKGRLDTQVGATGSVAYVFTTPNCSILSLCGVFDTVGTKTTQVANTNTISVTQPSQWVAGYHSADITLAITPTADGVVQLKFNVSTSSTIKAGSYLTLHKLRRITTGNPPSLKAVAGNWAVPNGGQHVSSSFGSSSVTVEFTRAGFWSWRENFGGNLAGATGGAYLDYATATSGDAFEIMFVINSQSNTGSGSHNVYCNALTWQPLSATMYLTASVTGSSSSQYGSYTNVTFTVKIRKIGDGTELTTSATFSPSLH